MTLRIAVAAFASWLALSSCSSPDANNAASQGTGLDEVTASTSPSVSVTDVDPRLPELQEATIASPIEERLGLPSSPAEWFERYNEAERGYQEAIGQCIREEGFEYFEYGGYEPPSVEAIVLAAFAPEEELREIGYGVWISLDASIPFLLDPDYQPDGESRLGEYFATLSEGEQQAFSAVYDRCNAEAQQTSPPVGGELPEELLVELEDLWLRSTEGPESVAVWADWAACVEAQGFDASSRDDLSAGLRDEAARIQQELAELGVYDDALELRVESLRELETIIAAVDADCSAEVDLYERLREIQFEYETDWLDENESRVAFLLGETFD